jgi:DNA-binding transcriptional regulator YiaG
VNRFRTAKYANDQSNQPSLDNDSKSAEPSQLAVAEGGERVFEPYAIREGAGLSMGEVAREARCSVSAISRWESGQRTPRGDAAERWAALLRRLSG